MQKSIALLAAASTASFLFLGCFGSDDEVTVKDAKSAKDHAGKGTDSLNQVMAGLMGGDYEYGSENLTPLQASQREYQTALEKDPTNSEARFGAALTEVLLAAQDPTLADLLNRTIEAPSLFDSRLVDDAAYKRGAILKKVAKLAQTYPAFHEIQDALAITVLPSLEHATTQLTSVYNDANFSIRLTIDGEVREIDHAEAGLVLAGLKALHGMLTLCLSYDIDIDKNGSYEYLTDLESIGQIEDFDFLTSAQSAALEKVTTLLAPNSTFLAVRPAWQARLGKVNDEIYDAVGIAHEALESVGSEIDGQFDDLITVCDNSDGMDCSMSVATWNEALGGMDSVSKYLKQPFAFKIDDLDTTIRVDFAAYFKIQDAKKMLPHYAFYPKSEWSSQKPVFYFTDATGKNTGDVNGIESLNDQYDAGKITAAIYVSELQKIIHFQDPTFQGFLPGATEAKVWALIRKAALKDEADKLANRIVYDVTYPDTVIKVVNPDYSDTTYFDNTIVDPPQGGSAVLKLGLNVMEPQFILETALR